MRRALKAGLVALILGFVPLSAHAGTLEGAAIGAGTGAVVAGPPGAVVGGVIGAVVGGPDIGRRHHRQRTCWRDRNGYRQCAWR